MNRISLHELAFENFSYWPLSLKYFTVIIPLILFILLHCWLILKPKIAEYNRLTSQQVNLQSGFEIKRSVTSLKLYKNQLKILNKKYRNRIKKLVEKNEISGLLAKISKIGADSGLVFEFFSPQEEEIHDFYKELLIHIIVAGEYHQLARFISHLAEEDRLITVDYFEIFKETINGKFNDLLQMKASLKIYEYHKDD